MLRAPLLVDPSRTASFDVDCEYTFTPECPEELPVEGGTEIVPELNAQARFARYRIGSKDAHPPNAQWVADAAHPPLTPVDGDNMDVRWPVHAVPGTRGFELLEGLPAVTAYDFFVWKGVEPDMHPYGACFHDYAHTLSTGVIEFLRLHGVDTVIVGGLATDYCVKHTALELRGAGVRVILNRAAVRGVAEDTSARAETELQQAGVEFVDSAADLRHLPRGGQ